MKGNNRPKGNKTDHLDMILLWILIIIHTAILFWIADFSKKAISYPDEIVYYDLAKSLHDGTAFHVHETLYGFRNLAYPLLLSPLMAISNTLLRVRLISVLNAILMSVTAFPVWMLCREMKMRRAWRWITVAVVLIWPDIITAGTFMSETLYWPLTAFAGWFCVCSLTRRKIGWAVLAGAACYGCYFCKELGMCFPLAYGAMQFADPLFQAFRRDGTKRSFGTRLAAWLKSVDWKSLIVFVIAFAALYLGMNRLLLSNVDSIYVASAQSVSIFSVYNLLYFARSVLVYFLAVTGAFLVLPVLLPLTRFRSLKEEVRKGWLFGMILLLGTVVTVSYIIGILEDLGLERTRLHLRYFAPYIMILLPPFVADWTDADRRIGREEQRKHLNRAALACGLFLIGWILLVKTPLQGAVSENLSLGALDALSDATGPIVLNRIDRPEAIAFDGGVLLSGGILCLLLGAGLWIGRKWPKALPACFMALACAVCLWNGKLGFDALRLHYASPEGIRNDMVEISNHFADQDLSDAQVLYVCNSWIDEDAKVYDLYFDAGREYVTTWESLKQSLGNTRAQQILLPEAGLKESIWQTPFAPETVDYFITRSDAEPLTDYMQGVEPVDIPTGYGTFRVWRNVNPENLDKLPDEDQDYLLREVIFTREGGYNADQYATGISGCEDLFSWSEGNDLTLTVPDLETEGPVTVKIDTYMTYNGTQPYIVYQNGTEIARGEMLGDDRTEFEAMPENGTLRLTIHLPNAISPRQTGQSEDGRMLALGLRTIRIIQRPAQE